MAPMEHLWWWSTDGCVREVMGLGTRRPGRNQVELYQQRIPRALTAAAMPKLVGSLSET